MSSKGELTPLLQQLRRYGYALLPGVFGEDVVASLRRRLNEALGAQAGGEHSPVLQSRGRTYGARNLLAAFPEAIDLSRCPALRQFLTQVLGGEAGLVRGLYFDKPPDRSWSLPWHRDQTIAVRRNDLPSSQFQKPTTKAGIPHVQAPRSLLERMLTLRFHLDAMTDENGPLQVIPGSHLPGGDSQPADASPAAPVTLSAAAGDVLAMRPLLLHASGNSHRDATSHRRVIHLEFAADRQLADGYQWHTFLPVAQQRASQRP